MDDYGPDYKNELYKTKKMFEISNLMEQLNIKQQEEVEQNIHPIIKKNRIQTNQSQQDITLQSNTRVDTEEYRISEVSEVQKESINQIDSLNCFQQDQLRSQYSKQELDTTENIPQPLNGNYENANNEMPSLIEDQVDDC